MINKFNKYKGFISISKYLLIYPQIFDLNDLKIIDNKTWNIDYEGLDFFAKHLIERYSDNEYISENLECLAKNHQTFFYIKNIDVENQLPELLRCYKYNNTEKSCENIIVKALYKHLITKEFNFERFKLEIKKEIMHEELYWNNLVNFHGEGYVDIEEPNFNKQTFNSFNEKENLNTLKILNKETEDKDNLFLGLKKHNLIMKRKVTKLEFVMPEERLLENVYMQGNIGSGVGESITSVIYSMIKRDISFEYYDNWGDTHYGSRVSSLFSMLDKENKFFMYSHNNIDLYYDSKKWDDNLNSLILNPIVSKCCKEYVDKVVTNMFEHFENLIQNYHGKKKHCIILSDCSAFSNSHWNKLHTLIPRLNRKNIFLILIDRGMWNLPIEKERTLNIINNHFVMKTQSQLSVKYYEKGYDVLGDLNAGEYRYRYNGKMDMNIYSFPYISIMANINHINVP